MQYYGSKNERRNCDCCKAKKSVWNKTLAFAMWWNQFPHTTVGFAIQISETTNKFLPHNTHDGESKTGEQEWCKAQRFVTFFFFILLLDYRARWGYYGAKGVPQGFTTGVAVFWCFISTLKCCEFELCFYLGSLPPPRDVPIEVASAVRILQWYCIIRVMTVMFCAFAGEGKAFILLLLVFEMRHAGMILNWVCSSPRGTFNK